MAFKEVNFKSKLLEWSQKNRVHLEYQLLKQKKDDNGSPVFSFRVMLEGVEGEVGTGFSKKEAQQLASKDTLQRGSSMTAPPASASSVAKRHGMPPVIRRRNGAIMNSDKYLFITDLDGTLLRTDKNILEKR